MADKDAYLDTLDRMEPDIAMVDRDAALASIAISLKRIADSLDRANLNGDVLANAIEGAIFRGLQK
jgi:hypothetical protein